MKRGKHKWQNYLTNLLKKLKKAQSPGEVAELLKADGQDESLAEKLWKELERSKEQEDQVLSLDELDEVAGGKRDWVKDGCAATVEPNSWCMTNDSCFVWSVVYEHEPISNNCFQCGNWLYVTEKNGVTYYQCGTCKTYYDHDTMERVIV